MRHAISKDLYAYWDGLRGARAAPDRNDIDPGVIRHLLADCFIVELDQACEFPLRLSGTRLNALWSAEGRGAPFLSTWREADRRELAAAMLTVIDGATPIVGGAKARARAADGGGEDVSRRELDLELLLLPLRHFGARSRLIGALAPFGEVEWFGRVPAELEIISLRMMSARERRRRYEARVAMPSPLTQAQDGRRFIVYEGGKGRA